MTQKASKTKRFIAVAITALFLLTTIPAAVFSLRVPETNSTNQFSEEELKTASDISNLTGVDTEKILAMKANGKTWNEILDKLKKSGYVIGSNGKEERYKLLTESGLSDSDIKMLKSKGISDTEITDAKLFAERVLFQLNEITSSAQEQANTFDDGLNSTSTEAGTGPVSPGKITTSTTSNEDNTAYDDLKENFDIRLSTIYMLTLKNDYGGLEQVMDEYLYSMQAGLNLEDYIADKNAYLEKRNSSSTIMDPLRVITVRKIEEKMLQSIQNTNTLNTKDIAPDAGNLRNESEGKQNTGIVKGNSSTNSPENILGNSPDTSIDGSIIPSGEVPENGTKIVRPENPADTIMNEIKELNPDLD